MMGTDNTIKHTDIKHEYWLVRFLPERVRPYAYLARLDRPIGWWLLLIPGLWAIALASGGALSLTAHDFYMFALFFIGAPIMRAAGCVINDLWDRDLDKQVERTSLRPIASGAVSVRQAFVFLFILLSIGLMILLQMSLTTILLGVLAIPLIVTYPYMKRITWWPQAFLGITFNFGALMGWAAIDGTVDIAALCLYAGGIFWTLAYDTIYAYQDIEDDMRIGIKSSARWIGDRPKPWIIAFIAAMFVCLMFARFYAGDPLWMKVLFIPAGMFCVWQVQVWQKDDPASSLKIFKSHKVLGLLIFAALMV